MHHNSALKSHRQLNKYIRLYHQELSAPMRDILRLISECVKNVRATVEKPVLTLELQTSRFSTHTSGAFGHAILDDLVKYSERCKSLHRKFAVSTLTKLAASTNELAVEICEYLVQFQAENREIEADNAPRGFKTRRRKALSDLFKILKELGILRPTVRRSVNDLLNLQSFSILNICTPALALLHAKSESYHFKTINTSSEIEGNVEPPHIDLSRRDCDLMTTTRHHILELTSNQRTAIQNLSMHQVEVKLFAEGLTIADNETVVVNKQKWNCIVDEIKAVVADFTFLFNRALTVFAKCPYEFAEVQSMLQGCLSDLTHQSSPLLLIQSTISFAFITEQQKIAVDSFIKQVAVFSVTIGSFLLEMPEMEYIADGFLSVLASKSSKLASLQSTLFDIVEQTIDSTSILQAGNVVTQMLLAIQHFNAVLETQEGTDTMLSSVIPSIDLACLERVAKMIRDFAPSPPTTSEAFGSTRTLFATLVRFTADYKLILDQFWYQIIISAKSSYKLSYILLNLYRFLHKNGYNIPEGHEENEEENDEPADGMGLADGTADNMAKDDIDNIDFEDGLTPDTNEPNEPGEEQDDGIDVEHDFDSKLEDVPNPQTGEDEKDESGSESDSGNLDEEMGDLDQKGEVLDENLWDEKDEKDDREEKLEDDGGVDSKGQEQETVANETLDQTPNKDEQKEDPEKEQEQSEFQETTDAKFEETQIEENHRQDVKDDEMDDLEIEDNPQQDDMSEDEGGSMSGDESDSQPILEIEQPKTSLDQADEPEQMKPSDTNDVDPDSTPEDESKEENDVEGQKEDLVNEDEGIQSDPESEGESKEEAALEPETNMPDTTEDDSEQVNDNANGTGSVEDADQVKESESLESESKATDDNQMGSAEEMGDGEGVGQASSEQQKQSKESKKDKLEDKPITPATTLAEMEKKMKTWLQSLEESSETPEEAAPNGESIVNAMDSEETDDIVMDTNNAKSKIDEIERSDQRKMVNETEEESDKKQYDMDIDLPDRDVEETDEQALPELSVSVEKRLVTDLTETPEASENHQAIQRTFDNSDFLDAEDVEMDEASDELSLDLMSNDDAREMWRKFVQLTEGLSFTLCEQLRLILEPTLTTKYRGDYRTGKRLNMRKIIPYIASHFKKDKIWLRRTKPSKRTYQIIMSIDDSKSMRDSGCTDIAIQSLVLITKSLQFLEAGELAVVGFGEKSTVIHEFSQQLNEEAGVSIIQNLKFSQDKTRVKEMLHHAFQVLEAARQNSRNKDVWQLQLILSDGICEDHKSITSLVTLAAEKRIMTVFIVLDTRRERDSIAKMATVSYTKDKDGESVLKMEKYMDTFPFEYYIILRDISGLPQVLAETLRQYFSFVNKD